MVRVLERETLKLDWSLDSHEAEKPSVFWAPVAEIHLQLELLVLNVFPGGLHSDKYLMTSSAASTLYSTGWR